MMKTNKYWTRALGYGLGIFLAFLPLSAQADVYGKDFGMGLMLGNPLGINVKGYVSEDQAIDGGVGLGFLGGERLQVHATYLWHFQAVEENALDMFFYTGVGPAVDIKEKRRTPTLLFLRVSMGLAFTFSAFEEKGVPIDLFVETAPLFGKEVKIDANLGARYWF